MCAQKREEAVHSLASHIHHFGRRAGLAISPAEIETIIMQCII